MERLIDAQSFRSDGHRGGRMRLLPVKQRKAVFVGHDVNTKRATIDKRGIGLYIKQIVTFQLAAVFQLVVVGDDTGMYLRRTAQKSEGVGIGIGLEVTFNTDVVFFEKVADKREPLLEGIVRQQK